MSALLLFPQKTSERWSCASAPMRKQNILIMSYNVSEVWSKTVHEKVGYLDEFGNHCSRPVLLSYFKGKTNQTQREGNYTET